MSRKVQIENPAAQLEERFARWDFLYQNGGSDPFYPDGVSLNLVRNHITYYKRQLAESLVEKELPEVFHRPTPPEVEDGYMARADEIRAAARLSLELYKENSHYQYLVSHAPALIGRQLKDTHVDSVLGCVSGLERAIAEDDLVTMRRHENASNYIGAFEPCVQRVKEALNQPQLNLFSMLLYEDSEDDSEEYEDSEDEENTVLFQ